MPKSATRRDWAERVARVVDHIADHLDEPLDLDRLARVACFSPFHFHRLWRGMTGETLADCLVRLRLHRASVDLVRTGMPIGKIAGRAGYGSVPAFSRAFSRAYGKPPVAYRRAGGLAPPLPSGSDLPGDFFMPEVRVQTIEPIRLAALPHQGPYTEVGRAFDRLWAWAAARDLVERSFRMIAVYHDDPSATPAEALRSDAGMTVPDGTPLDGGVHAVAIEGGRHAVVRHKGPYAELEEVYRWIYGTWLPGSGEEPADRPCFEEYVNNPRSVPPTEWLTDIHVPLKD